MESILPKVTTAEPLEVYIAYDSLPAIQAGIILQIIDGTYDVVLSRFPQIAMPHPEFDFGLWQPGRPRDAHLRGPQLSVETAVTGESIKWGFGPPKQLLPKLKYKNEDLTVLLPRWTAAAALTGAVLIGGLHVYKEILETIKVRHELNVQDKHFEPLQNIDDMTERVFENDRRRFREVVSTPNIRSVAVNGVSIARDPTPIKDVENTGLDRQ